MEYNRLLVSFRRWTTLVALIPLVSSSGFAGPAEMKSLVESLPAKLKALYEKNEKGFAGSTVAMAEACGAVAEGVMPDLVALEADGATAEEKKEFQEKVETELAGVGAAVFYENHATGWGGTITTIEVAAARLAHMENRIAFAVTKLYEEDDSFDLSAWHDKWAAAGGGGDQDEEPAEEVGMSTAGGTLRLARGSSGGSCAEPAEGWAEKQVSFTAKAGQKLVVAATGLRLRVLHVADDGALAPFTEWGRCHDVRLPASEGGRYRIEFGMKAAGDKKPAHLLVEIR